MPMENIRNTSPPTPASRPGECPSQRKRRRVRADHHAGQQVPTTTGRPAPVAGPAHQTGHEHDHRESLMKSIRAWLWCALTHATTTPVVQARSLAPAGAAMPPAGGSFNAGKLALTMHRGFPPHESRPSPDPAATGRSSYRWTGRALLFFAHDDQLRRPADSRDHQSPSSTSRCIGPTAIRLTVTLFPSAYAVSLAVFAGGRPGRRPDGLRPFHRAWSLAAASHALVATVGRLLRARVGPGPGRSGNYPAAIQDR